MYYPAVHVQFTYSAGRKGKLKEAPLCVSRSVRTLICVCRKPHLSRTMRLPVVIHSKQIQKTKKKLVVLSPRVQTYSKEHIVCMCGTVCVVSPVRVVKNIP